MIFKNIENKSYKCNAKITKQKLGDIYGNAVYLFNTN